MCASPWPYFVSSFSQVSAPISPSGVRPYRCWKLFTARSVTGPNSPSGSSSGYLSGSLPIAKQEAQLYLVAFLFNLCYIFLLEYQVKQLIEQLEQEDLL